jgi:hypothetical protein
MEALEAFMMAWDEGKPYDLISNRQQFYRMKFNNIN